MKYREIIIISLLHQIDEIIISYIEGPLNVYFLMKIADSFTGLIMILFIHETSEQLSLCGDLKEKERKRANASLNWLKCRLNEK